MRIKGTPTGAIHEKRQYFNGVVLTEKCPECGRTIEMDLGVMYLSQPAINSPHTVYFFCDEGHPEVNVERQIVVQVKIVKAS